MLDGRGSFFAVTATDATLAARAARCEIHPTGPLWGRGEPGSAAGVLALERRIGAQLPVAVRACAAGRHGAGASEPAAARGTARIARWSRKPRVLRFHLARGSFATAVLRELVDAPLDAAGE